MFKCFRKNQLRVLRTYRMNGTICGCGNRRCPAPGKHPAPWHGKKNLGVYNAKTDFTDAEMDGYNIAVATGGGLLVVDVDPRSGGHFTWADICRGNEVPDTWTVATGGGGNHYYFMIPEHVKIRSMSFEGVDFQYEGKYVVAPPSMHYSGIEYTFEDCDPDLDSIAEIPDFLIEFLKTHMKNLDKAMAPASVEGPIEPADWEWESLHEILNKLDPDITYPHWLGVGMGLHATGIPGAFDIWDNWSAKGEKYNSEEIQKKWSSFRITRQLGERHTYRWIYAMAEMYGIEYGEQNKSVLENWQKVIAKPEKINTVQDIALAGGELISELFEVALENSHTSIPEFALATALQVMSGCVQGSYLAPMGGSLNLYQWCAAPAGMGKDSYFKTTRDILKQVHEDLVSPDFGSVAGLRVSLMGFNSRVSIRDEFHDDYLQMTTGRNEYLKALLKDYKMLWNIPSELPRVIIKSSTTPRVSYPCLGLMSWGTVAGLEACASREFLTSGLGSRFIFWSVRDFVPKNNPTHRQLSKNVLERLKKLFKEGLTERGEMSMGGDAQIDKIQSSMVRGQSFTHEAQCMPVLRIELDDVEAAMELEKRAWHEAGEAIGKNLSEAGTLHARKFQQSVRLGCLRALSSGRTNLTTEDIEWGEKIVSLNIEAALEMFISKQKVSHSDEDVMHRCDKIEQVIARICQRSTDGVKLSQINQNVRIATRNIQESLLHLIAAGRVVCIDHGGRRVYPAKIEKGFRYLPG